MMIDCAPAFCYIGMATSAIIGVLYVCVLWCYAVGAAEAFIDWNRRRLHANDITRERRS